MLRHGWKGACFKASPDWHGFSWGAIGLISGIPGDTIMETGSAKVVHLHRRKPREALEHLNRVTGLGFSRWPESLVGYCRQAAEDEAMRARECSREVLEA